LRFNALRRIENDTFQVREDLRRNLPAANYRERIEAKLKDIIANAQNALLRVEGSL
jgi:hypothetical protein